MPVLREVTRAPYVPVNDEALVNAGVSSFLESEVRMTEQEAERIERLERRVAALERALERLGVAPETLAPPIRKNIFHDSNEPIPEEGLLKIPLRSFAEAHGFSRWQANKWLRTQQLAANSVPTKARGKPCTMPVLDHFQRVAALALFRTDARYHPCAWEECECHDE